MGNSSSINPFSNGSSYKIAKQQGDNSSAEDELYFGLENYGNTCYCNSVLQALFFCLPFRSKLLEYTVDDRNSEFDEDTLLYALCQLFQNISSYKRKSRYIGPKAFIEKLKSVNETFRSPMQQDAHEFLIALLNEIADTLQKREKASGRSDGNSKTIVHEVFEGILTNETKCLCCETITSKDESFLDLSLDIEQNTSITACLKNFSATETLEKQNKFYCEYCCSLQEAQKRMKIKKLPRVLIVHLKRFKYVDQTGKFMKLSHRVAFPMELRVNNTAYNAEDPERPYHLFAVVIHIGSGPNHGHYVSVIKSHSNSNWLIFDDEKVRTMKGDFNSIFGSACSESNRNECGYILFYTSNIHH